MSLIEGVQSTFETVRYSRNTASTIAPNTIRFDPTNSTQLNSSQLNVTSRIAFLNKFRIP